MAKLLDRNTVTDICVTAQQDYWMRRAPGWVYSEHLFSSGAIVGTDCVVMFKGPTSGFRLADWVVYSEQLETAGSLVLRIGTLNSSTTPTAIQHLWKESSTLGRAATSSMERNDSGLPAFATADQYDIGIHFSTPAATQSHTWKKIIMGVLFAPW